MLTTPHSLTGATIAVLSPNPFLAIPLAVGSHFILDSIPHWQETLYPYKPNKLTWVRIPIDLALSLLLVGLIASAHPDRGTLVWLGALGANIPDLDSVVILIPGLQGWKIIKNYWDWHCRIQKETASLRGVIPQLILSAICLWISLF